MIERIVRMTFRRDTTQRFEDLFKGSRESIRAFPGCTHLELWKDPENPCIYLTYSNWETLEDLENYRNSELFKGIWSKTKVLFAEKPYAFSAEKYL